MRPRARQGQAGAVGVAAVKALLRLALAVAGLFAAVLWAWSQIAADADRDADDWVRDEVETWLGTVGAP